MVYAAEENVDTVVAEGGISHIVPLLSFFPAPAADSKDRRYVELQLVFQARLIGLERNHFVVCAAAARMLRRRHASYLACLPSSQNTNIALLIWERLLD